MEGGIKNLGVDRLEPVLWSPPGLTVVEVTTGTMQPKFVHCMWRCLFIQLNGLVGWVCLLAFKRLAIESGAFHKETVGYKGRLEIVTHAPNGGCNNQKLKVCPCCILDWSVKQVTGVWHPWEFRRHSVGPLMELWQRALEAHFLTPQAMQSNSEAKRIGPLPQGPCSPNSSTRQIVLLPTIRLMSAKRCETFPSSTNCCCSLSWSAGTTSASAVISARDYRVGLATSTFEP